MSVARLYHDITGEYLDVGLAAGGQGGTLNGAGAADSTYRTKIGDIVRDEETFRFRGMHGSFVELHGVVGRPIVWQGFLRVTSAALATIRAQRDYFRLLAGVFTFIDDDDTDYGNCTIRKFDLGEKQRIQVPGTDLVWRLPYTIVLQQQEP